MTTRRQSAVQSALRTVMTLAIVRGPRGGQSSADTGISLPGATLSEESHLG